MGFEPPILEQPADRPPKERRAYGRRSEDHQELLRAVISLALAICGGLAVVFLFFAAMGAVDLGEAIVATAIALVMAGVWFAGFWYRHRTHADRQNWRDRERRGF
jgi:hypothetical protein